MLLSPGVSSPHSSAMGCGSSDPHNHILIAQSHATTSVSQVSDGVDWKPTGLQNLCNTCYLTSVLQCLFTIDYYTSFLPVNTESPLIKILKEFTENKKESKDVRDIRTLLISNEIDSILSNAEQNTVHSEVQGIFHTNRQQDAHESLLIILNILHNCTKIDFFPGLGFSQEAMKYSSIIRNTFYGIINSTHTCTACKWITTTSSTFCELKIALESDNGTSISMSKHYNFTKCCYLCNSNKLHTNQNVIIQQPLISTICVNRFHRSKTSRLSKNTAHVLCNKSIRH